MELSTLPSLADFQATDGNGQILAKMQWISEEEWVELEDRLRALAGTVGLTVDRIERLTLHGDDTVDLIAKMSATADAAG